MTIPTGQPFSRVYGPKGPLAKDSQPLRVRLLAFVKGLSKMRLDGLVGHMEYHGGLALPGVSSYWQLSHLFLKADIGDVLDAVTYIHHALGYPGHGETSEQITWREHAATAFDEEGLAYRVDSRCGVHYYVDVEFERGRIAAVAELQGGPLAPALGPLEDAFKHLEARPQDRTAAIRSMFEAVESLTKIIDPRVTKLNKAVAKDWLKNAYLEGFAGDKSERKAIDGLFDSLGEWVDALHEYRHGQDEVRTPSEELAIYVLASGCAHLRWLAPRAAQRAATRL